MDNVQFKDYSNQFIRYLREQGKSVHTLRAYRADLEALSLFWQEQPALTFKRMVYLFLDHCMRQKQSDKKTLARKISCLHSFEKFLTLHALHLELEIYRPIVIESKPSSLSIEEITFLLDEVKEHQLPTQSPHRDKAIFELLYATGIQPSQLVKLTFAHVSLPERKLIVQHARKGERLIVFGSKAAHQLELYIKEERPVPRSHAEHIFLNHRAMPLTTRSIQKICNMFSVFLKRTCIITPMLLRHSCALHLLQQGASPELVQELLGLTRASVEKYVAH